MLVRFTVENFMSFKERTEFNMLSGDYRRHKHHITNAGGVPLVRAAAIYGANGSGKSNLVKAMKTYLILNHGISLSRINTLFGLLHFMDSGIDVPIHLSAELITEHGNSFEWGVEILGNVIVKEWLSKVDIDRDGMPEHIYVRTTIDTKSSLFVAPKYIHTESDTIRFRVLEEKFSDPEKVILPMLSGHGIDAVEEVQRVFVNMFFPFDTLQEETKSSYVLEALSRQKDNRLLNYVNELITKADIGITEIQFVPHDLTTYIGMNEPKLENDIKKTLEKNAIYDLSTRDRYAVARNIDGEVKVLELVFIHKLTDGFEYAFRAGQESDGTLTSVSLLVILAAVKHSNQIFIIDEVERSLHPLLVTAFIKKFMADPDVKGQLMFTTHESRLLDLDIFRQDEIWFAQKNQEGVSSIYPLSDYEDVRSDLDIENGYLNGRFGGVPFLGKLEDIANENAPDNTTTP